jgi:uracil-DNA glycosylase
MAKRNPKPPPSFPIPWLDAELQLVKPRATVCLGATVARALRVKS